jgi:hypothetical protein
MKVSLKNSFLIVLLSSCTAAKTVVLDGSKSFDPDGYLVRQRWVQLRGNNIIIDPDSLVTKIKLKTSGVYQLTVIDNDGAQDSDTMTILK